MKAPKKPKLTDQERHARFLEAAKIAEAGVAPPERRLRKARKTIDAVLAPTPQPS